MKILPQQHLSHMMPLKAEISIFPRNIIIPLPYSVAVFPRILLATAVKFD